MRRIAEGGLTSTFLPEVLGQRRIFWADLLEQRTVEGLRIFSVIILLNIWSAFPPSGLLFTEITPFLQNFTLFLCC